MDYRAPFPLTAFSLHACPLAHPTDLERISRYSVPNTIHSRADIAALTLENTGRHSADFEAKTARSTTTAAIEAGYYALTRRGQRLSQPTRRFLDRLRAMAARSFDFADEL